jgi:hypothetical protein
LLFEFGVLMARILLPHRRAKTEEPADQATS